MKRIDELMGTVDRGAVTPMKPQSKQWQTSYEAKDEQSRTSYAFWVEMQGIYSDRWQAKNGRAPSLRWREAITALTDQQLQGVISACVHRCCEGNTFPPDLAEFMSLASRALSNPFGLEVADIMSEFRLYCRERYLYSCAETFPWDQDVLYWIVCDMRREMHQRNLNDAELEKRAAHHLKDWAQKVRNGQPVPKPKPLLSEKARSSSWNGGAGHASAMSILETLREEKLRKNQR